MSDLVYPTLSGLTWNVKKVPEFNTIVHTSTSLKEFRIALAAYPLWSFSLTYERLLEATDYKDLLTFFLHHKASYESWLFNDASDNTVTNNAFATGDGTTTTFQITRTISGATTSFTEPIQNINNTVSPIIRVDSSVISPAYYSINSLGVITFNAGHIPASGKLIDWTGSFYYRCRFLQDMSEFNKFMKNLWENKKVDFRSEKL